MFQTEEADSAKLSNLCSEKVSIEQEMKDTCLQLEKLQNTFEEALLQIIQIKSQISKLQEHHHHFDKPLMAHDKILVESEVASWLGDNVLRPLASVASQNLPLPKYDHDKLIEETSHFNDGALDSGPFNSQHRGFSDSSNEDSFMDQNCIKMAAQKITPVDLSSVKRPFTSAFSANVEESFKGRTGRVGNPIPALPPVKSKQPRPVSSKAVTATKVRKHQALPTGSTISPAPLTFANASYG
ncbi:hypothetical protein DAPPUDRAFT_329660 [Daphnia pulex]|uniref:Uncharacterized protein n=1 Tax=Daphnia pulex TaxID=6669 RepID=E9HHA0_DAPPU|nr:hypothetical protein DAPPUDRAFT_329660 [Daphnia pulex]|eukprot:EFX68826.1 hypothetical protein DAPPUDRAFT_329660 [Daphnia pulex]